MVSHQMSQEEECWCCDDDGVRTGTGESGEPRPGSGVRGHEVNSAPARLQAHNTASNMLQRERGMKRKYVCIQIFQASDLPNKRKITTVWLQLETKESLITCRVLFISDASI